MMIQACFYLLKVCLQMFVQELRRDNVVIFARPVAVLADGFDEGVGDFRGGNRRAEYEALDVGEVFGVGFEVGDFLLAELRGGKSSTPSPRAAIALQCLKASSTKCWAAALFFSVAIAFRAADDADGVEEH